MVLVPCFQLLLRDVSLTHLYWYPLPLHQAGHQPVVPRWVGLPVPQGAVVGAAVVRYGHTEPLVLSPSAGSILEPFFSPQELIPKKSRLMRLLYFS